MIKNFNALLTSLLLFTFSGALNYSIAQKPADFLPANTFFSFSINGANLQKKMSLENFQKLDFYKEFRRELEREGLSGNLTDLGLDWNKELTFFAVPDADYVVMGVIMPIQGSNLTNLLELRDTEQVNGITYQNRYGEFIGYNDSYLILANAEVMTPYPGWDATEEEQAAYDLLYENRKTFMSSYGTSLFSVKSNGLSKQKNFISSYDQTADANFYMALTNELAELYMDISGLASELLLRDKLSDPLKNLVSGDQYWSSQLFFEDDQILIESKFFPNEENMNIQKAISKSKLNTDLLKYVNQESLLGVYNVNLNTEEALKLTPSYFSPLIDSYLPVDKAGDKIADLITAFLDEESLAEMINGNLIVAVSNLSLKETQFISYDYDEDFNMTETAETGTELIPDLLGIIQSSNPKNLNSILELAAIESPLVKEENYFTILAENGLNFPFYIFTTDEGLFFTNSKAQMELIQSGAGYNNIDSGLAKDLKKNSQNLFVNTKMIFQCIPTAVENKRTDDKVIEYLRTNTTSMKISQAKPKGDSVEQKMIITVPEKGYENSLSYLFNLINDIYKIAEN